MHSQELKGTIVPAATIVNLGLRLWDLPATKLIKV